MTKQFIACYVLGGIVLVGCGGPDAAQNSSHTVASEPKLSSEDVAAETLGDMLLTAEKGDWEEYVDRYYGEQHKFRSPADRAALVRRFKEKWGEKLVAGLRRATAVPVHIDGDKAVFLDGDDPVFILHRSQSGDWKFHL